MTNGAPAVGGNGSKNWYVQVFQQVGCPVAVAALLIAWDAGWLPSTSREALPIVKAIKVDTGDAVRVQQEFKDAMLSEIRAIRRRQAALCLVMLTAISIAQKDLDTIRQACVSEALHGVP